MGDVDFVVVGNVARDLVPGGWRAGGTAVYAALTARGLGRRVGVVTAAPTEVLAAAPLQGVAVVRVPAAESPTFENRYTPAGRVQYLRAAGAPVPAAAVPAAWRAARVALLGPVYHEVDVETAALFTGLRGLCAQGYLRRADADGRIRPVPPAAWRAAAILRHTDVLIVSEEDLGGRANGVVAAWAAQVPVLAVTAGRRGARVHAQGVWRHIPACPAREVDPTGAGDAFAAALLIALDEGAGPWRAAYFAAAAASLVVEAEGPVAPERAAVLARMRALAPVPEDAG
jgi:sugar/nucleoside kinase (ribokinase family)